MFLCDGVGEGFNGRVDEFYDQHQDQGSQKEENFEHRLAKPNCDWQRHDGNREFLPEGGLVPDSSHQALKSIPGSRMKPAKATTAFKGRLW